MYQRKVTKQRKHRKYEIGREAAETKIGKEKKKKVRIKGGGRKIKLLVGKYANVMVKGKPTKCEILSVQKNPANKYFIRRNIITKGAILKAKTPDSKEIEIRVTSRPGQDGVINGVALK